MNARDITLESLRAEVAALNKKLDAFERQPQYPITITPPELKNGERAIGVIVSADGTKREWIILLPGSFTGNHADAMNWAESIGGELPDRAEGALMFAMKTSGALAGEFEDAAYWTREIHASDSDYAWGQNFGNGGQYYWLRGSLHRARTVRRLPI